MCVEGSSVELKPCRFAACYGVLFGIGKGAFRRPGNLGDQCSFFSRNRASGILVKSCRHGTYRFFGEIGQGLGYILQKFSLTRVWQIW